jgi:uncharacterized protein (TIGR00290 family)
MKVLLAWSSGKDSAYSLHVLRQTEDIEVIGLLTTVNAAFDRVAMHGVRRALVEAQARAAGLCLTVAEIPHPCPNAAYQEVMGSTVAAARERGVEAVAFGDLALENVRSYREEMMMGSGLKALFPLWGRPTATLAREMIDAGMRAVVTALDLRLVPEDRAGRAFDHPFLDTLPAGLDPCGENGEFHTFAWDGPMFQRPVAIRIGETVKRDGFVFADVLPTDAPRPTPAQPGR